ncbi:hypothetical protein MTO96_034014 [Rhipicephalus appendiculatus]
MSSLETEGAFQTDKWIGLQPFVEEHPQPRPQRSPASTESGTQGSLQLEDNCDKSKESCMPHRPHHVAPAKYPPNVNDAPAVLFADRQPDRKEFIQQQKQDGTLRKCLDALGKRFTPRAGQVRV